MIHPPPTVMQYDCFNPEPGQPQTCFEVTDVESMPGAYQFCDVVASPHNCMEVRLWPKEVKLYKGYFLSEFHFVQMGDYQSIAPPGRFKIVHGKDRMWKQVLGQLAYDDGLDRPVLDKRCINAPDDTNTICNFTQENSNESISAGPVVASYRSH